MPSLPMTDTSRLGKYEGILAVKVLPCCESSSKNKKKKHIGSKKHLSLQHPTNVTVDGALESFVSGVLHHVKLLIRDQTKRCV